MVLRASARREARIARLLRGQATRGASAVTARLRLPMLPRLGGAGPMAHRYLTAMFRESTAVWMLIIAAVTPLGLAWYLDARGDPEDFERARWFVFGVPVYLTFIFVNVIRFDFRADFVVLDYLKTLPLRPLPCAIGGVAPAAMFATAIQTVPSFAFAIAGGGASVPMRLLFLLFPANFIWFALDNAFYLRAPTAIRKGINADPSVMARQIFSLIVRTFIMAMVLTVTAGSYYLVRSITGNIALATVTAWLILLPIAAWSAYLAGVALRDLDLSRDVL